MELDHRPRAVSEGGPGVLGDEPPLQRGLYGERPTRGAVEVLLKLMFF